MVMASCPPAAVVYCRVATPDRRTALQVDRTKSALSRVGEWFLPPNRKGNYVYR
jgi:hypothetical protein